LRRGQTGDLDISLGLVSSTDEYEKFVSEFELLRYTPDEEHPYRWKSPTQIPGAMSYVDILSHPTSSAISENAARVKMGVGPDFSLNGMNFAMATAHKLGQSAIVPTFVAMLALKLYAYRDSPDKRRKDFADIVEICWSLVERGGHFDLDDEWNTALKHPEGVFVSEALAGIANDTSTAWDLEDIRQELLSRKFSEDDVDSVIQRRFKEIAGLI
jgi:hypothetical protein